MYKNIACFDENGVVIGIKMVGVDCEESADDMVIESYVTEIIETTYDDKTGKFKDKEGKVKHTEPKKPKLNKNKQK